MLELKEPVPQLVQVRLVVLTQIEADWFIPADKRVLYLIKIRKAFTFYLTLTEVLIKFYICLFDFWHKRNFVLVFIVPQDKKKKVAKCYNFWVRYLCDN